MKTLALNILDIVQNSISAKADEISIEVNESKSENRLLIRVRDNGAGINEEILPVVTDPFLGFPLLKYHANLTGGDFDIFSEEKKGTVVTATFSLLHLDRQPLGDIEGVLTILIGANPEINFNYYHITDDGEYRFSTRETKEYLGIETMKGYELLNMIGTMINENLRNICVTDRI